MKRLYLLRHAKSSWKNQDLDDFDRPLNDRGKRDVPVMGRRLKKANVQTDLIISSPAKRAHKTAKIIAKEIGFPKKRILTDEAIYLADVPTLLDVIQHIDNAFQQVILVGHNPGFTDLATYFTEVQIDNIPTCGIFCIDFDIQSWKEVSARKGKFIFLDYPKKHT